MGALMKGLLETGAPWGLLCASLVLAVAVLWKRCNILSDRLYDLAVSQVKVNTETKQSIVQVERDVDDISRKFKL